MFTHVKEKVIHVPFSCKIYNTYILRKTIEGHTIPFQHSIHYKLILIYMHLKLPDNCLI